MKTSVALFPVVLALLVGPAPRAQQAAPPSDPADPWNLPAKPVASGRPASVKDIFEKYNLLGTYAWDCTRPPHPVSNWHFVTRVRDAGHVERDFLGADGKRAWSSILDHAAETAVNEIAVAGTRDGVPTSGVWRLDRNRMLQWEAVQGRTTLVAGGHWLATGRDIPWLNRCGD